MTKKICEILEQNHTLTAPQILEHLSEAGVECNKTTVYRALERMSLRNEVCRHMFGGQTASYELRKDHHDHLVCTNCGAIKEVPCITEFPPMIDDFQVDHHHLTLFGLCANCQRQTEKLDQ